MFECDDNEEEEEDEADEDLLNDVDFSGAVISLFLFNISNDVDRKSGELTIDMIIYECTIVCI